MASPLHRSKKGQFYILIALLLISYAFSLARQDVPMRKPRDTFQLLHEGYISEGAKVINNAVYWEANVTSGFAAFTSDYVAFAKSAEPGFALAYLLKYKDQLTVGNRFGSPLNLTVGNANYLIPQNSETTLPAANTTLRVAGFNYNFGFTQEEIQLKALFRTASQLETRVFVSG